MNYIVIFVCTLGFLGNLYPASSSCTRSDDHFMWNAFLSKISNGEIADAEECAQVETLLNKLRSDPKRASLASLLERALNTARRHTAGKRDEPAPRGERAVLSEVASTPTNQQVAPQY